MVSPPPSKRARVVKLFSRLQVKRNPRTAEGLVKHLRVAMNRPPLPLMMPTGVRLEKQESGPLRGDVMRVAHPRQTVLYVHGGGYVAGHPRVYRNLCSRLAQALTANVYVPEYRLAPEAPFPAALDDVRAAYEALLADGVPPAQLTVAGDSAGGGLTLALLLSLRDDKRPLPKCAVVLSPLADLTFKSRSISKNDRTDDMLSQRMIEIGADLYVHRLQAHQPLASPAFGDYQGLCPLFITVCEEECLRDDAYAVLARAHAANVKAKLLSRQNLLHVWPIFVPIMPEANEDFLHIVRFIDQS
jgi:monoterpene epsilon-lactone hydrolase